MLLARLRVRVIERIAQGDLTERALARKAGVSPSHLHNVLKGTRTMTPEVADHLMATLGWTAVHLRQGPVSLEDDLASG